MSSHTPTVLETTHGGLRDVPPEAEHPRASSVHWRQILAPPLVAIVTVIVALVCTGEAGVRFRDPDNVALQYVVVVALAVALLVWLDVAIRAARRDGVRWPSRATMSVVRRERWTRRRMLAAAGALLSFYVTYLAYRNLKSVVPLLRPELFDDELARLDRDLFLGHDPAVLLHDAFGMGFATHVLSTVYAAFIVFLPLSLAIILVFARRLKTSLFFTTALSINWLIGAGTYFLIPALGPIYADPGTFAALPHSEVTRLQEMLLDDRIAFLRDPQTGPPQHIAAFASLHIAMSATALAAAYLVGAGRRMKIALWAWLVLTTFATIYFGWHYVVDDVAGILMAVAAIGLARLLTGYDPRAERVPAPAT